MTKETTFEFQGKEVEIEIDATDRESPLNWYATYDGDEHHGRVYIHLTECADTEDSMEWDTFHSGCDDMSEETYELFHEKVEEHIIPLARQLATDDAIAHAKELVAGAERKNPKQAWDADPNLARSHKHHAQISVTFGMWKYRKAVETRVGGNATGMDLFDSAISSIYDNLELDESGVAFIELTDHTGRVSRHHDEESFAEDWLKSLVVKVSIDGFVEA